MSCTFHHRKRSHFYSLWNGFCSSSYCVWFHVNLPNTIQKICVPNSVLFHDVFDIVRFKCFTKFFACQKVFELHMIYEKIGSAKRVVLIGFSFPVCLGFRCVVNLVDSGRVVLQFISPVVGVLFDLLICSIGEISEKSLFIRKFCFTFYSFPLNWVKKYAASIQLSLREKQSSLETPNERLLKPLLLIHILQFFK